MKYTPNLSLFSSPLSLIIISLVILALSFMCTFRTSSHILHCSFYCYFPPPLHFFVCFFPPMGNSTEILFFENSVVPGWENQLQWADIPLLLLLRTKLLRWFSCSLQWSHLSEHTGMWEKHDTEMGLKQQRRISLQDERQHKCSHSLKEVIQGI